MKAKTSRFSRIALATAFAAGVVCFAGGVAAAAPVDVTVAISGTPAFGATVTAKATVTINDGSTLQSYAWSQVGGVDATLTGTSTDTVSVTLPGRSAFRDHLMDILAAPPLSEGEGEAEDYFGGLQNRFGVVGVSPLSLEETGAVTVEVAVVTSSGTYRKTAAIATPLPWSTNTGLRNVAALIPVLLHGKDQASYNWALTVPTGSSAALVDPTSQSPEFTPDVPGTYTVTVTDVAGNKTVTLPIIAGLWRGVITGQDSNGRPQADTACTGCHAPNTPLDLFTPWAETGHAEIFAQNVNTPNGHYSASCLSCHTVGYDTAVNNNGVDDQSDFQAFLASGLLTHGAAGNWTSILAQFPKTAKLANIQCENCHGPQNSTAHAQGAGARETLSSDLCGTCHGEPARHGRFQQWQLSGHANYELAVEEGTSAGCAPCHSAQGFLAWEKAGFTATPSLQVTWTTDEVHPQTCQVCHDPHAIGTTSGGPTTNATVRISGSTPMTMGGYTANNVGRGAICITCHNGRRGLRNDSSFNVADASRAPHVGPQGDVLMGQNFYFVDVGTPSYHARVEDACVTCHMEATPPPPDLSYQLGGTNHTFFASKEICSKCHATITADDVQAGVVAKVELLKEAIVEGIHDLMAAQVAAGKKIDLGGKAMITDINQIATIDFTEASGRQAIAVVLANGTDLGAISLNNVKVVPTTGSPVDIYRVANPALPKAGWNLFMIESDASEGVHNPSLINRVLDVSIYAVKNIPEVPGTGGDTGTGGGLGNGAGAVSCTTPYVYWAEIATHAGGAAGSQWRTDLVGRNLASATANIRFVLHTESRNVEATSTIPAGGQGVFEDLVQQLGVSDKGALEVCSSQPLLVMGRIFNQSSNGTYGQFLDGHVANLGLSEGQTATLLGLRQESGKYRTNISVTNGGTASATVTIALYDTAGTELTNYNLTVPSGKVVQDLQPFVARANAPDLGWGFATVKVVSGANINTSASVIDMVTNDPTTIPAKR